MTHSGTISSHFTSARRIKLRETKLYWVSATGIKYRKSTGSCTSSDVWSCAMLDLNTVKLL
jgi:hypothetical protein